MLGGARSICATFHNLVLQLVAPRSRSEPDHPWSDGPAQRPFSVAQSKFPWTGPLPFSLGWANSTSAARRPIWSRVRGRGKDTCDKKSFGAAKRARRKRTLSEAIAGDPTASLLMEEAEPSTIVQGRLSQIFWFPIHWRGGVGQAIRQRRRGLKTSGEINLGKRSLRL
jgi:hypothetical protein